MRLHAAPPLRFRLSKAAAAAGVAGATRFLEGDVTRLADDNLGDPFELVYELKWLHGLPVTRSLRREASAFRPGEECGAACTVVVTGNG
jgi:hypothetical protein